MNTTLLLLLGFLCFQSHAQLKVGMTEFLADLFPQFVNFTETGECAPSFECDIITTVCALINQTCTIVPLVDLDARFGAIESGDVDITISLSSVSPERAERVHFVRPHYYYSGAQIFVLDTVPESEHPTWDDLKGTNVCVLEDYYAIDAVQFAYEPNIVTGGTEVGVVLDGTCDYVVTDSTDIIEGMVASSNALIEFGAPYGIAVSQDEREGLGAQIGDALVTMMSDGPDSQLLALEEKYLITSGFPENQKLFDVVTAITEAGAALPGPVEDAIWDE